MVLVRIGECSYEFRNELTAKIAQGMFAGCQSQDEFEDLLEYEHIDYTIEPD